MAFALRMNFVDVICDDSLKNIYVNGSKIGYQFDIRLSYYRGQYLSVFEQFEVYLDGERVEDQDVKFCLKGQEFSLCYLPSCYDVFWPVIEPATITVRKPGGLAAGEHKVEVKIIFRAPYMPIGPVHQYMPYDSSGDKTMLVMS